MSQITVKHKKGGTQFEILCKGGTIVPYRQGKCSMDKCLLAEEIFKNASKFQKVKSSDLKKAFGTDDKNECLKIILSEGTFPLTKDEINKMIQEKKGEIINYINKYYQDPSTDPPTPHPASRIEQVLQQMQVKFDPHEPVQNQLKPILKKLPDHLRVKPVGAPLVEKEMEKREARSEARKNEKGKGKKSKKR